MRRGEWRACEAKVDDTRDGVAEKEGGEREERRSREDGWGGSGWMEREAREW